MQGIGNVMSIGARLTRHVVALLTTSLLIFGPAAAQETPAATTESDVPPVISVELNKIENGTGGCRSFVVLRNDTGRIFDSLQLDLVLFDPDGIIVDQFAVDMAPLPTFKTMVKVFEIAGHECGEFGRILLNDVLSCRSGETVWTDCVGLFQLSSRAAVDFVR